MALSHHEQCSVSVASVYTLYYSSAFGVKYTNEQNEVPRDHEDELHYTLTPYFIPQLNVKRRRRT